jgi:type I restriction enzyme S subunit
MKSEWKDVKLGDITEIVMGQSPPSLSCGNNKVGFPLLNGPTEFGSHHPKPLQWTTEPKKQCQERDILFCVRGSVGKMNWANQQYAIGRGIAAIRHKKDENLNYFVWSLLKLKLDNILAVTTGSIFPNVNKDMLHDLSVLLPPMSVQYLISASLCCLDKKIELNNKINDYLAAA